MRNSKQAQPYKEGDWVVVMRQGQLVYDSIVEVLPPASWELAHRYRLSNHGEVSHSAIYEVRRASITCHAL